MSFKGKGLRIGNDSGNSGNINSKRMRVIKAQMDYLTAKSQYYTTMAIKLLPPETDEWYVNYIVLFFIHIATEWIVFEKIRNDKDYIKAKQQRMIASARTFANVPLGGMRVIDEIVSKQVEDLINELVDVEKGVK